MNKLDYALTAKSGPSDEPVSLSEAKDHERVDQSADDDFIEALIVAGRQEAENFLRRALITQTWEQYLPKFPPGDQFRLRKPPLQTVGTFEYTTYDGSSDSTTSVPSSKYRVDTDSVIGGITLKDGEQWPDPSDPLISSNPIRVEFTAGYGDNPEDVPEPIRLAIKQLVGHFYEHRESVVVGTTAQEIPMTAKSLLWSYRIVQFG